VDGWKLSSCSIERVTVQTSVWPSLMITRVQRRSGLFMFDQNAWEHRLSELTRSREVGYDSCVLKLSEFLTFGGEVFRDSNTTAD
jgi:hypothetical protein